MYAAQGGICSVMKVLVLDGNADLEIRDKYGNTAMHYAIAYSQIAAANFLEDQGADALALNDNDESPTDVAAIKKDLLPYLSKRAMNRYASIKSKEKKKSKDSEDDDDYNDDDYEDDADHTTDDGYSSYSSSAHDVKPSKKSKSVTKKLASIADEVDKDVPQKSVKPSRPSNSKEKTSKHESASRPVGRPAGRPASCPGGRPGGRPRPPV